MQHIRLLLFWAFIATLPAELFAANDSTKTQQHYEQAYNMLAKMLQYHSTDFKTAVYYVESAYFNDSVSYAAYNHEIKKLAALAMGYARSNDLLYRDIDSLTVVKHAATYKIMTDIIPIMVKDTIVYHKPYTYNFSDYDGSAQWTDMFVSTLLETHKGNCHSLPYLYKMILQELGDNACLALAPNHIYIKTFNKKSGWFNTELTSNDFPLDAWVMASGYVHLNAVQNAIYMDTIGDTKSIAMCLIDLAQGYEAKMQGQSNDSFILKCCQKSLEYFPNYINALLLQSKVYERQFALGMAKNGFSTPQQYVDGNPIARKQFILMNEQTRKIHDLGYRKMPGKMYLEWLATLKTQKEKYSNKKISTFN